MATIKGVIDTAFLAGTGPNPNTGLNTWQTPGYIRGAVRVMVDWYVLAGTETSGTVIWMHPPLEAGAMILFHVLGVSAAQTSLTCSVGDLDSATRYASAITSLQTAGSYLIGSKLGAGPYIIGTNPATPTATDTDAQIILTTGGATATAGTIGLETFYTID